MCVHVGVRVCVRVCVSLLLSLQLRVLFHHWLRTGWSKTAIHSRSGTLLNLWYDNTVVTTLTSFIHVHMYMYILWSSCSLIEQTHMYVTYYCTVKRNSSIIQWSSGLLIEQNELKNCKIYTMLTLGSVRNTIQQSTHLPGFNLYTPLIYTV